MRCNKLRQRISRRKPVVWGFGLLIAMLMSLNINSSVAVLTSAMPIQTNGRIVYFSPSSPTATPSPTRSPTPTPSPTPSPSPKSLNLAVIPDAWEGYADKGRVVHGPDPQIVFVDTSVTHNGHVSIRCDGPPTRGNPWREVDAYGTGYSDYSLHPGDHVVFKIWIKTAPSTLGGSPQGAIPGIDLYGNDRVWEVCPSSLGGVATDFNTEDYAHFYWVPYNTATWVQRVIDFIVPSETFTHDSEGGSISPQQIRGMIPWIVVDPEYPSAEAGTAWFADAELYINP